MEDARVVHATSAPAPDGSFSQAVVAGPFIYVSGQGPFDPATGEIVGAGVVEQTHQVINNLEAILRSVGATLGDVVKVDAHLSDFAVFDAYDGAYRSRFEQPWPARKTVESHLGGILVEMDCIAYTANG